MIIGGWRGPGWQVFDADPRLGSQIRDWIRSAISGHGCPVDAADAALVVTELFGNACSTARPAAGCWWATACGGRARGWSSAMAAGLARRALCTAVSLAEGGRGLHVVDSLAARWGSFRLAGAQAVWCDFGQPLHAAASDAWAWLHPVLAVCDLSAPGRPVAAVMPDTLAAVGAR